MYNVLYIYKKEETMKHIIILISLIPGIALAQQRWENDPNNWKNSTDNYQNSPDNYRNSPYNWVNSADNYFNRDGIYNNQGDRIGYEKEGSTRNYFDNEGNRKGYR